jgi:hypothetical protein
VTRLWWIRARNQLRQNKRQAIVICILGTGSISMILQAWRTAPDQSGFWSDLWLNIGAGLAITIATYIALNPLFRDLQTASIVEHARLDPGALVERVAAGRETVAILETWTGLLEEPHVDRFIDALRSALRNQATVRILLLDPDSEGARLRGKELRQRDVPIAIMGNLYTLARLRDELSDDVAQRLKVRIYDASPSVQMYRCDNKAFISFFPIDQSTYDAQQIETLMNTPIGDFVQGRFEELWTAPSTVKLTDATTMSVELRRQDADLGQCDVRFVRLNGRFYVTGRRLLRNITRFDIETLRARLDGSDSDHLLDEAEEADTPAYSRMMTLFRVKYGLPPRRHGADDPVMIELTPDTGASH